MVQRADRRVPDSPAEGFPTLARHAPIPMCPVVCGGRGSGGASARGIDLSGDGGADLLAGLAEPGEVRVAGAKPLPGVPGDVPSGLRGVGGLAPQVRGPARREAVALGGLDEHAAGVGVAGAGDGAGSALAVGAVLAGHEADEGHELPGRVESGDVAEFGG